jgi:hypothetical protein
MKSEILLGFEVGTAKPVYVPLHHLAIFGITQLSGKTTTLEALISRSGRKAVAFITKRGECGFRKFRLIPPYYKARSDWQYVEGLVNVALGEKVKYEPGMRYGIIRVCQGCRSIQDVRNAALRLSRESRREFMRSVYEKLVAYLDIVIPELEKWRFSDKLELDEGVNVMDVSEMSLETQQLVIASTIEFVFQNMDNVIVIIPEAWESLPQGKMTPVKWVAQQFIRKGAAVGNFLWIDSQDIGGTDKTPLRQVDVWLFGRMREAHEVERILKQLLGKKVKAEEIQTLPLGHFFTVVGDEVKKVYVLPAGVPEEVGMKVARGELTPEFVRDNYLKVKALEVEDEMYRQLYEEEKRRREELEQTTSKLKEEKATLEAELKKLEPLKAFQEAFAKAFGGATPSRLEIEHKGLVVNVKHAGNRTVRLSTDSVVGQVLFCAVNYFKEREFTTGELNEKLLEHGWNVKPSTLSTKLSLLVNDGLLIKTEKGYRLPSKVVYVVESGKQG